MTMTKEAGKKEVGKGNRKRIGNKLLQQVRQEADLDGAYIIYRKAENVGGVDKRRNGK